MIGVLIRGGRDETQRLGEGGHEAEIGVMLPTLAVQTPTHNLVWEALLSP